MEGAYSSSYIFPATSHTAGGNSFSGPDMVLGVKETELQQPQLLSLLYLKRYYQRSGSNRRKRKKELKIVDILKCHELHGKIKAEKQTEHTMLVTLENNKCQ